MNLPMRGVWLLILAAAARAQTPASDAAAIATGKILLTQLSGDSAADGAVFQQVGADRAAQSLTAVMSHGMGKTATVDDWADLHRALRALSELEESRNKLPQAATYAFFDDAFYRTHERDYESALASARRAFELQKKAGQPLFLMYKAIGDDLRSLNRLSEALQAYAEAEQALPDPVDKTAATLGQDVIATLLAAGQHDEARTRAERMVEKSAGAPPIFQARARLALSMVQFSAGEYESGIEAVKSAMPLVNGTADAASFSWEAASQVMAAILDGLRELSYGEAERLAKLADSEIAGLPVQVSPFARMLIRQRRRLAGDVDAVLREDVAAVEQTRKSGNQAALAEALRSLAASYASANGMRQRALALQEAADLERGLLDAAPGNLPGAVAYFQTLLALGDAWLDLDDAAQARKAFSLVRKTADKYTEAASQNSLKQYVEEARIGEARGMARDDDPDGARDLLRKQLASVSAANKPYLLLARAQIERDLNEDPAAAVDAYRQAIELLRAARDYPQEMAARIDLVHYLATSAIHKVADALQTAREQLAACEKLAHALEYAQIEWRIDFLNGILLEAGNPQAAIERYRQAVAKLDRLREGLTQQEQRQAAMDSRSAAELYARLVGLLSRAGSREEAWQYTERAKARSFLEALHGRHFTSTGPATDVANLARLEKQIADVRFQLTDDNAAVLRTAGREPAALRLELKNLEDQFTLARGQANLAQSRAGQVLSLHPPALAEIQKALPEHAALLEYSLLDGEIGAFVVTRSGAEEVVWKADTNRLPGNVTRLRSALSDPESKDWAAAIDQMSKVLIAPLASKIPVDTKQLLVVPAGSLNYLPFGVLSANGRALIETYSIGYLPSASALLYLGAPASGTGKLFLGALGANTVEGMPPLPGTLVETAGIAAEYPKAQRVTGRDFTHDVARQALLTADTVHFATHGLLEKDAPLFSAVLTNPAPGQPARLALYEIVGMKLRARLVVLSACETGLGKLSSGDEITGLTRTFLTAGADSVVSSLWKVSDESTAMLMQEFYRQIDKGLGPGAALRESALAVRARYAHPFYWAPFVVTGRN